MGARRISIVPVSLVVSGLLLLGSVGGLQAAGSCALAAPTSVKVGDPLDILGSGFPASRTVDVSLKVQGGPGDAFTVQSDASGAFKISLTPEESDAGVTTLTATAGTTCSAAVTFAVRGANTPAPTPAPTATATSGSRGAAAGASAQPSRAPRTDAVALTGGAGVPSRLPWALGVLVLVLGLAGLAATRPARSR